MTNLTIIYHLLFWLRIIKSHIFNCWKFQFYLQWRDHLLRYTLYLIILHFSNFYYWIQFINQQNLINLFFRCWFESFFNFNLKPHYWLTLLIPLSTDNLKYIWYYLKFNLQFMWVKSNFKFLFSKSAIFTLLNDYACFSQLYKNLTLGFHFSLIEQH
jgi:hypothetical protein